MRRCLGLPRASWRGKYTQILIRAMIMNRACISSCVNINQIDDHDEEDKGNYNDHDGDNVKFDDGDDLVEDDGNIFSDNIAGMKS